MADAVLVRMAAPSRLRRGITLPIGLLVLWELASHSGLVSRQFLPPLEQVALVAWRELASGELVTGLLASLRRDLLGFVIGASAGVAFGTALGLSRIASRVVAPWFHGLRQIALLAWIPLISVWFGFDDMAKVVFIALAAAIPVALNTLEGVGNAPRELVEVGEAFRFSRAQFIRKIYLPAAVPSIVTGIHLGLIYSWLATIGAEYFMAIGPGIGGLIIAGRERFEMDLVMLGMLVIGIVGFTIDRTATAIEYRLMPWKGG